MKRIKKIYRSGTSNVITINKDDMIKLDLKIGDYIEVDIRKEKP